MFMNLLVDRWITIPPIQLPCQRQKASLPDSYHRRLHESIGCSDSL